MASLIKNRDLLAVNPLRERALKILEAGLEAIDTRKAIRKSVSLNGDFLFVKDHAYDLTHYRRIFLVAFGKDSFVASSELKDLLGERIKDGVVLSLKNEKIAGFQTYQCTHPQTSLNNVEATKKVIEMVSAAEEDDLILVVISGGGSAMLTSPYKITFSDKALIADTLMNSGANISELNIVRKHLSEIKGGRLAALSFPSTVVTLIFSDVVGNDLSTIASGPTVMDHTSIEDAKKVLEKFKIKEKVMMGDLELTETPKEEKYFQKVQNYLLMDNSVATGAMEEAARALAYSTRILSNNLKGNSHEIGKDLLKEGKKGEALIAAGETTVQIVGQGLGGRNQEMALANLENVKDNQILISVGSDGHDHSEYAGGICDAYTKKKATEEKLDPKDFLGNNDSYHFFQKLGEGIDTGQLESNVADLMLVLTDLPNV
ncbi:MAG TPA: DUF4147 domain-containing protein [Candidatus Saccharimonadales bacterium]|nr:DUF4147 domain-containing protein [Candidatus Saccharimonadales bacterium]